MGFWIFSCKLKRQNDFKVQRILVMDSLGRSLWASGETNLSEFEMKKIFDMNRESLGKYSAVFDYMYVQEQSKWLLFLLNRIHRSIFCFEIQN